MSTPPCLCLLAPAQHRQHSFFALAFWSRHLFHDNLQAASLNSSQVGVLGSVDCDAGVKLQDIGRIERQEKRLKFVFHARDDESVLERVKRVCAVMLRAFVEIDFQNTAFVLSSLS
ncbi:hypothetical protein C8F01DRAFT_1088735 [Mycena amicta]|nr:hypothetical protein C8F01DRAFT_1088735 [Mycena amicta]